MESVFQLVCVAVYKNNILFLFVLYHPNVHWCKYILVDIYTSTYICSYVRICVYLLYIGVELAELEHFVLWKLFWQW